MTCFVDLPGEMNVTITSLLPMLFHPNSWKRRDSRGWIRNLKNEQ